MRSKKNYGLYKFAMALSKAARSFMGVVLNYAKRKKQRNEETSPFAIRYRAFRDLINNINSGSQDGEFFSIWCVDWDSIIIGEDNIKHGKPSTLSFMLLNTYKSDLPPLKVDIKLYSIGMVRFIVNETDQFIKLDRFQLPYNDIIKDKFLDAHYLIKSKDKLKINTAKDENSISIEFEIVNLSTNNDLDAEPEKIISGNMDRVQQKTSKKVFKLVLTCNHFKVETFVDDCLIHSINPNGNFNFERVRPFVSKSHPNIKRKDLMKIANAKKASQIDEEVSKIYDSIEKKIGITNYFEEISSLLKERRYHKKGWGAFESKLKESYGNEYVNGGNIMEIIDSYDVYSKNSWHDIYDRYPDYKIYGPTCIGTDIQIHNTSNIYGASEHSTEINLPEYPSSYRFYNLDVFTYKNDRPDALYGSIPLVLSVHNNEDNSFISGILWLNPSDTFMDIKRKLNKIDTWWVSETGIMDFVLMVSDNFDSFYYNYHILTGFPTLTPRFALGKHQSRWFNCKDSDVLDLSSSFEKSKIPLDSIWLDIEHLNKRKCFTWNPDHFKDVSEMLGELDIKGRNLIVIADPHISIDESYHVYNKLQNQSSLPNTIIEDGNKILINQSETLSNSWIRIRNRQEWEDFVGVCWPGKVKYPDFLNPSIRDIYSTFYTNKHYPIMSYSNIGFWIDMNEPSVFSSSELTLPKHSFHYNDIEHRQVHNLYGYYHLKSTFNGLLTSATQRILSLDNISNTNEIVSSFHGSHSAIDKALATENKRLNERLRHDRSILELISSGRKIVNPDNLLDLGNTIKNIQRPFILTRSFYIGSHCYGFTWTGDNKADYDSFSSVISMNVSNSVCGLSYTGSDVGGFYGHPCKCLFLNWHKLSIWMPFYRVHSHIDSPKREPWEFGPEILKYIRKLIIIRYELLSFWYTISSIYSFQGKPMLQPLNWLLFEFKNHDLIGKNESILKICECQSFVLGGTFLIYNTLQNQCICKNNINGTNYNDYNNGDYKVKNKDHNRMDGSNAFMSLNILLPYKSKRRNYKYSCSCNDDKYRICKYNDKTLWYEYNSYNYFVLSNSNYIYEYLLNKETPFPCFVKEASIIPYQSGDVLSSAQQLQITTRLKVYLELINTCGDYNLDEQQKMPIKCTNKETNSGNEKIILAKGNLFLDDGVSYNYLTGEYLMNTFYFVKNEKTRNNSLILSDSDSSRPDLDLDSGFDASSVSLSSSSTLMANIMLKSPPMTPSSVFSSISSSSFYSSMTSHSENATVITSVTESSIISNSKHIYEIYCVHKSIQVYSAIANQIIKIPTNYEAIKNNWIYRNDIYLETISVFGIIHKPKIILLSINSDITSESNINSTNRVIKKLDFTLVNLENVNKSESNNLELYNIEINIAKLVNLINNNWKISIYV
ncbi:alpha glucosidase-like family 31 glycosyl hydrolase [Cryptosporidium ubiquitum]|uniref:Glucosidase II subunit alpha n=1 Tax=Cryptosporidium ubiquitum TaxID=857276 RepID=A0A1J4MD86_9CRYT|nr:alpha glucosidase-like family 31 glycosyl hydrolase [Cryptosporidium ubiquitum]OII70821.1 alpha glucosidase-like family 31 glycosyl hydrolase [Cryptosporidium ubiquitum]